MNVFDRLLATDEQIARKQETDRAAEQERLAPLFAQTGRPVAAGVRRRLDRTARIWIFTSVVWVGAVLLYAMVFDPFDGGGWERMSDNEILRVFVVAALPVIGWLLTRAYRRWVA